MIHGDRTVVAIMYFHAIVYPVYCFSQNFGMLGSVNKSRSGGASPVKTIIRMTPPLLPSRLIANASAALVDWCNV